MWDFSQSIFRRVAAKVNVIGRFQGLTPLAINFRPFGT